MSYSEPYIVIMAQTLVGPWSMHHPFLRGLTSNKKTRTNMTAMV